jgi:hypothetical protein
MLRWMLCFIGLGMCASLPAHAQTPPKPAEPAASVSGRVTLDGKPVAGAKVIALSGEIASDKSLGKTTTDAAGRFRLGNLPGGAVRVLVGAGAAVSENDADFWSGKSVTLAAGEALDDLEIKLRTGGVITGRVIDSEKRPVAGETVTLLKVTKNAKTGEDSVSDFSIFFFNIGNKFQTDDRGVYRMYGLPPGRYVVGVGNIAVGAQVRYGFGGQDSAPSFHPKGKDWKQATIIELTAGAVAENRDILVGDKEELVTISGRLVDDETGAPVAKMNVGLSVKVGGGAASMLNGMSDARGEFLLTQVKPGEYQIITQSWDKENNSYSDPIPITVRGDDVKDLVIRMKRGVAVSGRVEVTGAKPETVPFAEYYLGIRANIAPGETPSGRSARLEADGSFAIRGLRPGTYTMSLFRIGEGGVGRLDLFPVELQRNGAALSVNGFEIGTESVDGLRVLARVGTGKLRGEIRFVGGEPAKGTRYGVSLKLTNPPLDERAYGEADDRHRFLVGDLLPGDYAVTVYARQGEARSAKVKVFTPTTVTISETGETTITITVDLSTQNQPQQP